LPTPCENDIQKDIPRTFPEEAYFSSEKYNRIGQEQLLRMLKALSLYFPKVGYCQGMSYLAGFLLLVSGGKELEAFWVYVTLARDVKFLLMGFYEKDFPLLEFYMHTFYELLQVKSPNLYKHLKAQLIPDQLWLLKWFLTMFLINFPPSQVIRIWDYIMQDGLLGLVKVGLSLCKLLEKDMLTRDIADLTVLFNDLKGEYGSSGDNLQANKGKAENQYHFKELNIEKVLKNAKKIGINSKNLASMAKSFTEKTGKTLPQMYEKFFSNYKSYLKESQKQEEAQKEISSVLIKPDLNL